MRMRVKIVPLMLLVFLLTTSFSPPEKSGQYQEWAPLFMKRADLEVSVKYMQGSRPMKNPGKIYCKDHYIFINELYKGVHVINNSNPANPVREGFISAPGCVDMAVKENTLYIDNSVDLVALDLATWQVTERIREVFPEPPAPDNNYYYSLYQREEDMVLVGWELKL